MTSVNPFIMKDRLNIRPSTKPVKQRMRRLHLQRQEALKQEVRNLLKVGFISEIHT